MVRPQRGEIWWAQLDEPKGSQPSYHRPVLIVQDDRFNRSQLATVIILSMTSNPKYRNLPGNVFIPKEFSGLPNDSVINVTQMAVINKEWLDEFVDDLPRSLMAKVDEGLRLVLGLL
jgi:mRNA interferase MazF